MSESKPIVLRSAANPTVRHLVRMRENRARRKAGRVVVDGWRETVQANRAGLHLCGIYLPESACLESVAPNAIESGADAAIGELVADPNVCEKITCVSDPIMEKISYGQSSRGVVAEFEQPGMTLEQLDLPKTPFLLVLDHIEKPGNMGAVFRCADAAGVDAVLLCGSNDLYNPNAIRASLGSVFHVQSASGSESQLAQFLASRSIRVVAARVESSTPLWSADLDGPLAIVLGSESDGLGNRWRMIDDTPVEGIRIPMEGSIDSLNVSVSAAVISFEANRRRRTGRTLVQDQK